MVCRSSPNQYQMTLQKTWNICKKILTYIEVILGQQEIVDAKEYFNYYIAPKLFLMYIEIQDLILGCCETIAQVKEYLYRCSHIMRLAMEILSMLWLLATLFKLSLVDKSREYLMGRALELISSSFRPTEETTVGNTYLIENID